MNILWGDTLRLCKYSASHQTCWINYYKVANTDFLISSFLLCSIVGMLLYGRAFPSLLLIYEFMYPFIHSYQLGLMDYFIQQFVICFYYYLLWYSVSPRMAGRSPFKSAPTSSWDAPIILWTLPFWHKMKFQVLTFSQPRSWNWPILQGALVPCHGEAYFRNHNLGTKCARC